MRNRRRTVSHTCLVEDVSRVRRSGAVFEVNISPRADCQKIGAQSNETRNGFIMTALCQPLGAPSLRVDEKAIPEDSGCVT